VRILVVGGGIVGAAAARLLAADHDVLLLEKEDRLGAHQTGHNSGVVHAGLYYAPNSLKARLCRRGGDLLRAYCAQRDIPLVELGKLVVALDPSELDALHALGERAQANGVRDLRVLDAAGLRAIEPHATGAGALHSPHTAVVDFAAVTRALAGEVREVRTNSAVRRIHADAAVELETGELLAADRVLVCAGLQSDRLARASGQPREPAIVPFRGDYWRLRPERAHLVRGLIYPVPDPELPFLGTHLTRRLDGEVWVGPNAALALARERYSRHAFVPRDAAAALAFPGTRRLLAHHWRAAVRALRAGERTAIRYIPELTPGDLERGPCGIRAQALERSGTLLDDFALARAGPVVFVRNAPSPAATAALAIAEELYERLR
jgi:L-2-hydroxyglutarate oxidase LhgO